METAAVAENLGAVVAENLGVRTRRGWVFSGVSLAVPGGSVLAVAGPGGSGRSSLLLTIGGRMKHSTGSLKVCGLSLPAHAAQVRRLTAVARITGAAEPEPGLSVRSHVRERALAAKVSPNAFTTVCKALDLAFPTSVPVEELPAKDTTALALALALMERPRVVLLDDLDAGVDADGQRGLWQTVRTAASGVTVVATTTDGGPAMGVADTLLQLPGAR